MEAEAVAGLILMGICIIVAVCCCCCRKNNPPQPETQPMLTSIVGQ